MCIHGCECEYECMCVHVCECECECVCMRVCVWCMCVWCLYLSVCLSVKGVHECVCLSVHVPVYSSLSACLCVFAAWHHACIQTHIPVSMKVKFSQVQSLHESLGCSTLTLPLAHPWCWSGVDAGSDSTHLSCQSKTKPSTIN